MNNVCQPQHTRVFSPAGYKRQAQTRKLMHQLARLSVRSLSHPGGLLRAGDTLRLRASRSPSQA